jgi:Trypsin-like peptidase domain
MTEFLAKLFANRKTYLAAAGLAGLAVYQFSQQDYAGAVGSVGAVLTMLGLKMFPEIAKPPAVTRGTLEKKDGNDWEELISHSEREAAALKELRLMPAPPKPPSILPAIIASAILCNAAEAQTFAQPTSWQPVYSQDYPLQCPGGQCPTPIQMPRQPAFQPIFQPIFQPQQRPQQPPPSQQQAPVPEELVAASCKVWTVALGKDDNGGGTGVLIHIDPAAGVGYVITNHHVTGDVRHFGLACYFPSQQAFFATELWVDQQADLAVIAIPAPSGIAAIALADALPSPGASVWQVGYPQGYGPKRRSGQWQGATGSTRKFPGGQMQNYGARLDSRPGDSGSGLFTQDRRLAALLWGGTPNQALFVGLPDIVRFTEHCFGRSAKPPGSQQGPSSSPSPNVGELAALKQQLADLLVRVATLEAKPLPAGLQGPQGPPGKDGMAADPSILHGLQSQIAGHGIQLADVAGLKAKLAADLPGLQGKLAAVEPLVSKVPDVLAKVEQLAAAGGAAALPAWLVPLVLGTGPPGLVLGALALFLKLGASAAAKKNQSGNSPPSPPAAGGGAPSISAAGSVRLSPSPADVTTSPIDTRQSARPAPPPYKASPPEVLLQNQPLPVADTTLSDILQSSMKRAAESGLPNAGPVIQFVQQLAKQEASGRGVLLNAN